MTEVWLVYNDFQLSFIKVTNTFNCVLNYFLWTINLTNITK